MSGSCCTDCAQKSNTLGTLGWLPTGFGSPTAEATALIESPQFVRAASTVGLAINGALTVGGVMLWKKKHHVWGTVLVLLGGPALIFDAFSLATGKAAFAGKLGLDFNQNLQPDPVAESAIYSSQSDYNAVNPSTLPPAINPLDPAINPLDFARSPLPAWVVPVGIGIAGLGLVSVVGAAFLKGKR